VINRALVLEIDELRVHFQAKGARWGGNRRTVRAVDGISLSIAEGETLGLVGESGSGKSTVGTVAIGLQQATSGAIRFRGEDILDISRDRWRALRRDLQIVFQDPFSSLNPRRTVGQTLAEPLLFHKIVGNSDVSQRVEKLLGHVGLSPDMTARYPHSMSGGQCQRVGIARALAVEPSVIILDEVTSALDVSTQAQILALLRTLQEELAISFLLISHDLGVIRYVADRVAVMYLGRIVEIGNTERLFSNPSHPYTQALLSAVPVPDPVYEAQRDHYSLGGTIPDPADPPSGCRFRTRCPHAVDQCATEVPVFEDVSPDHQVACHRWREIETLQIYLQS